MNNALASLIPLIEQKSKINDPVEFHAAINVAFHDVEAKHYDSIHDEMWQSLPFQYQLLVNDISGRFVNKKGLKLLDIGCGTGLATNMLLDAGLKPYVDEITLLDTSAVMLSYASKRAKNWNKKVRLINGDVGKADGFYDIIIISSVLHHIPDLHAFLQQVNSLQHPEGILITIHDPTNEALQSITYQERAARYNAYLQQHPHSPSFKQKLVNRITRLLSGKDYISSVNKVLLKANVIKEPLTAPELWSVTDIHVEDLPYSANSGIALSYLKRCLSEYNILSYRTYAFFGVLYSNLPDYLKKEERELSMKADSLGRNFASIWVKNKNV